MLNLIGTVRSICTPGIAAGGGGNGCARRTRSSVSWSSADEPELFDAGVYAQINKMWRMQLNVENILDTGYWASADGNNNISPGQGRTFRMTAIANF